MFKFSVAIATYVRHQNKGKDDSSEMSNKFNVICLLPSQLWLFTTSW